jgi:translation initiation factor 1
MSNSRLVYTTDGANNCPDCKRPLRKCQCKTSSKTSSKSSGKDQGKNFTNSQGQRDGIIRIGRETKGRKGSGVTLISGLQLTDKELQQCARQLKTLCGSGGTIKQGVIEIQGDHRQLIKQHLEQRYAQVKLAGG